jgi:succinate dehydrogenase/fumarate reductase flavoprotein subunit
MGMVAGEEAARSAVESRSKEIKKSLIIKEVEKIESLFGKKGTNRPIKIERELQKIMRENGGIVRDEPRLNYVLTKIESMQEQMEHDVSISTIRRYNSELIDLIELKNMLILAKIIVICARMRTESRGAHLRLDYPDKDDANWLKNIIVFKEDGEHKTSISEINAGEIRGEVKTG